MCTTNAQVVADTAATALAGAGEGGTVAVVGWIGYYAPLGADVASYGDAHAGSDLLKDTLWGIDAARQTSGAPVHLTAVAHSYGSVVGGLTSQAGTPMDDLVLIGSPGAGVTSAAGDLDVGPYRVFVGAAVDDPVSHLARFGPDPASDDFGGNVFEVNGGTMPGAPGHQFLEAKGHSDYYGPGTESLQNIVNVVVGHPENVTYTTPDPYRGES